MLILSTFFLLTWKWPKIGRNVVFIRDFYSDIKFQIIHCSQRQGGYLENQRVSQQRQRKATNHYLFFFFLFLFALLNPIITILNTIYNIHTILTILTILIAYIANNTTVFKHYYISYASSTQLHRKKLI